MSDDERLAAVGKALAAAENDPLQPAPVVRAFLAEPVALGKLRLHPLTMLGYLRLEAARSPFVTGEVPAGPEDGLQAFCTAVSVLAGRGVSPDDLPGLLTPEEAARGWDTVAALVAAAWETALPMRRPTKAGEQTQPPPREHGFGWWLRVLAKLVSEAGLSPREAMDLPMAQAFALLAACAALDGQEPREMNYREREAEKMWKAETRKGSAGGDADVFDPAPDQGDADDLGQKEDDGPRPQGIQGVEEFPGGHTENDTSPHA